METLEIQAEIVVLSGSKHGGSCAPEHPRTALSGGAFGRESPPLLRGSGVSPPEKFCICKILHFCNLIFGLKMVCNAVHNAFLNTLTMGTAFPRVPPRNDPRCKHTLTSILKWKIQNDACAPPLKSNFFFFRAS